ncbi:restriction endonuclease subunit S [Pseudomonas benzopyrenica]|uniref:Restriction endonuclease subunit S n=1 Tax=Pseudomonas benzopyrenica TaxID=2993566 RepID=A0ABZ2FP14_9PSED
MSELPANWATCTLGELVERIETGKSVKCDERPPQGLENGLVKISAVTWGEFDENESKTLFDSIHLKPEDKIKTGDFLISRANTLELVGSCVLVKSLSKNLYLSDKVLRLVLSNKAKPWLLVCLRSQAGRQQIESLATGNQLSMRNISQQALKEIRIPLPPLAEQTRIAAKLDELLVQVDTLKARIDGIPSLLKRFRQSVLSAAVSGRLTEEWRTESESYIHPYASEWKWHPLPKSWQVKFYAEVTESRLGKMLDKAKNSGIPTKYLGNINVRWFDFELNSLQKIPISTTEREELAIRHGDILICEGGEPGRCAIWDSRLKETIVFQKAIHRARVSSLLLPKWLAFNLKHDADDLILEQLFTGTTIKHLTGKALKNYPLRVPPLEEQTEIVRRVEQLFAFADQLEARVKAAQTRIDRLTQSILAKAFRGELVPQDPNDESASVLLERIKAQRAAEPKAKRGRGAATLI